MARSSRSDSTASDASFDGLDASSSFRSRYRDDETVPQSFSTGKLGRSSSEDALAVIGDEEEAVGLMQLDRDGSKKASPQIVFDRRSGTLQRLWKTRRGYMIALLTIVSTALGLSILAWLAEAPTTHWATVETVIPGPAVADSEAAKIAPAKKWRASKNTASDHYGLKYAEHFHVTDAVPGFSIPEEADEVLGLTPGSSRAELKKQGLSELKPVTLDVVFNGTSRIKSGGLRWSAEDPDEGVFIAEDPATHNLILEDVTHARREKTGQGAVASSGGKTIYIDAKDVKDLTGRPLSWQDYKPSPDMSHCLFLTNEETQSWGKSRLFNAWIHDVKRKVTYPVGGGPTTPSTIAHVAWIPSTPSSLAYIQNNDLYVSLDPASGTSVRITSDGAETIFNAVTDWAYEEEVFSHKHALWFSPGGTKLAYLRFDETEVPVYQYPLYNQDDSHPGLTKPHPTMAKIRYPKPGFNNPIVTAHLVDISRLREQSGSSTVIRKIDLLSPIGAAADANAADAALGSAEGQKDRLVTEVAWLNDDTVVIRETDRFSDKMRLVSFDAGRLSGSETSLTGQVVRRRDVTGVSWVDATQELTPLGAKNTSLHSTAYIEILPDEHGYRHIGYFATSQTATPTFLTSGHWEVDEVIFADLKRSRLYFSAAHPLPYHRRVYHVPLPDISKADATVKSSPETDLAPQLPGHSFSADFDPKGAYFVLNDVGPGIPSSRVIGIDDGSFELVLEDNAQSRNQTSQHVKSQNVFYEVTLANGVVTTVQETRPYDFDPSGTVRYPVLLSVYGGPESGKVSLSYKGADWHEYLANQLGYIIATVDGRGTGFKGAAYSDGVTKQLGSIEVDDLIATAGQIRRLAYVDEKRIGVWGWSYGGYLTSKVLERDSGIINLGMAVAPVSRWEFYDSIYTERYMKSVDSNAEGYEKSAVHITDGFKHAHYLLAQGSGDDNVHFESSAHLLDLLTAYSVRGFWFRMFTDSRHNVNVRGAYRELHEYMTNFLKTKWGAGGRRRFGGKGGRKGLVDKHSRRQSHYGGGGGGGEEVSIDDQETDMVLDDERDRTARQIIDEQSVLGEHRRRRRYPG